MAEAALVLRHAAFQPRAQPARQERGVLFGQRQLVEALARLAWVVSKYFYAVQVTPPAVLPGAATNARAGSQALSLSLPLTPM